MSHHDSHAAGPTCTNTNTDTDTDPRAHTHAHARTRTCAPGFAQGPHHRARVVSRHPLKSFQTTLTPNLESSIKKYYCVTKQAETCV